MGKCRICPYPLCVPVTDPIVSWRQRVAHPIGGPGAEPLTPVSVGCEPYHRNSTRGSPSKHHNTVVAPMLISSSQSKQTLGSPPTRDNFQYAPYSYTT